MKVEVRDGKLCVEIEMQEPKLSASGKSYVVASTHGNMKSEATVSFQGQDCAITIGLNAYVKPSRG
jgi:hypothetical protein